MTKLSPAAEAVLDAVHEVMADTSLADLLAIAAALRAAADQVEPDDGVSAEVRQALHRILVIADELDSVNV